MGEDLLAGDAGVWLVHVFGDLGLAGEAFPAV